MSPVFIVIVIAILGFVVIGRTLARTGDAPAEWKYFKPYSLTWLSSVVPGLIGLAIALEPLHGFHELAASMKLLVGSVQPSQLIWTSLVGIGLVGRLPGAGNA